MGLIGSRDATYSVGKCVGESPVGISFLFHEIFPALCTSAFFSSLLSASARPQAGYGHFAEVYSQLQPHTSEQPSGAVCGHRLLCHWAQARIVWWEMWPPREKPQDRPGGLVPSPGGGALVGKSAHPKAFFTEPARGATGGDPTA